MKREKLEDIKLILEDVKKRVLKNMKGDRDISDLLKKAKESLEISWFFIGFLPLSLLNLQFSKSQP
jgi:hypothetical protein